eukprot:13016183-Ditylum_brightwellii.AAC.1
MVLKACTGCCESSICHMLLVVLVDVGISAIAAPLHPAKAANAIIVLPNILQTSKEKYHPRERMLCH